MGSKKGDTVWNDLPVEIIESVFSFLPTLNLCRMRLVCTTWNELICSSSFHDLHDRNAKDKEYLFMQRYERKRGCATKKLSYSATLNFFDRDTERWYSIPTAQHPGTCGCGNAIHTQLLAMDNGLICELASCQGTHKKLSLVLLDPIAKMRRVLPTPPTCFAANDEFPFIVIVVDDVTLRYKIFLFNNLQRTPTTAALPRAYVHDAFSKGWRIAENVPNDISDGIAFRNNVLAIQIVSQEGEYDQVRLFTYHIEGNSFAEIWRMSFQGFLFNPQLIVNENRLFLNIWSKLNESTIIFPYECPNSETLFPNYRGDDDVVFEIYEILIAKGGRKPVVQFPSDQLEEIFHDFTDVSGSGFPCYNSNDKCTSVVLTNSQRGDMGRYHMETGKVDVLPLSPVAQIIPQNIILQFPVKAMKLSLRNLLQHCPTISTGWRLLE